MERIQPTAYTIPYVIEQSQRGERLVERRTLARRDCALACAQAWVDKKVSARCLGKSS